VPAAIVAHGGSDIFGNGIEVLQQIIDGLGLQVRMAFEGFVEVRDVSSMVLVMVDFHGPGVNVRFQSVEWVWQRGQGESHGFFLRV
jgi:hypothetical protein